MYLQDMLTGIERIDYYIEGFNFKQFKQAIKQLTPLSGILKSLEKQRKTCPKKSSQNIRKSPGLKCIC